MTRNLKLLGICLIGLSYGGVAFAQTTGAVETPWAWYFSRSAALLSFTLLYLSIFLGLTIRIVFLRKLFSPLYALNAHKWLAVQALIFALAHGLALMFDKTINFDLKAVFIPFAANYQPYLVGFGTITFYLMLLLIVTSYGRKFMSPKVWRTTHSLNIGLYFLGIVHALSLGTDLRGGIWRSVFIWANVLLGILFIYNLYLRLALAWKLKRMQAAKTNNPQ